MFALASSLAAPRRGVACRAVAAEVRLRAPPASPALVDSLRHLRSGRMVNAGALAPQASHGLPPLSAARWSHPQVDTRPHLAARPGQTLLAPRFSCGPLHRPHPPLASHAPSPAATPGPLLHAPHRHRAGERGEGQGGGGPQGAGGGARGVGLHRRGGHPSVLRPPAHRHRGADGGARGGEAVCGRLPVTRARGGRRNDQD